jgi:hypothetical protein
MGRQIRLPDTRMGKRINVDDAAGLQHDFSRFDVPPKIPIHDFVRANPEDGSRTKQQDRKTELPCAHREKLPMR